MKNLKDTYTTNKKCDADQAAEEDVEARAAGGAAARRVEDEAAPVIVVDLTDRAMVEGVAAAAVVTADVAARAEGDAVIMAEGAAAALITIRTAIIIDTISVASADPINRIEKILCHI